MGTGAAEGIRRCERRTALPEVRRQSLGDRRLGDPLAPWQVRANSPKSGAIRRPWEGLGGLGEKRQQILDRVVERTERSMRLDESLVALEARGVEFHRFSNFGEPFARPRERRCLHPPQRRYPGGLDGHLEALCLTDHFVECVRVGRAPFGGRHRIQLAELGERADSRGHRTRPRG